MLVICPTPIGNLEDVTVRQRRALESADIIACEDTRRTGKLLEHLGVERTEGTPVLRRYDDHTAAEEAETLADEIARGTRVVLVSDAGTPAISDPGYRLVRACRRRNLEVTALPGAVAAAVALSASGLASDRFFFEGFLSEKQKRRLDRLELLDELEVTFVVYASPWRIEDVLKDIEQVCGAEREVCVGRELTKRHEEFLWGSITEVRRDLGERESVRGEFTVCVGPRRGEAVSDQWEEADRLIRVLDEGGTSSRTIKEAVDELYDVPRSKIYDRIEQVTDEEE